MNAEELNQKIREVVGKYHHTRYVHNGRSIEEGLDCLGFIILFYRDFGIYIPNDDGKPIEEEWYKYEPERYIQAIHKLPGRAVRIDELEALDMVYFVISRNIITHSGVMINRHEFIHMSPKRDFQVSRLDRVWRIHFRGAVRLRELDS